MKLRVTCSSKHGPMPMYIRNDNVCYTQVASWLRLVLGQPRLTAEQSEEVRQAIARRNVRRENRPADDAAYWRGRKSRRQQLVMVEKARKRDRVTDQLEPIFKSFYRTPASRWIGGEWRCLVEFADKPWARTFRRKVRSRNGKWSGLNATFAIAVSPNWETEVLAQNFALSTGALVTHVLDVADHGHVKLYTLSRIRQGRGLNIVTELWYATIVNGHVYNGKTPRLAWQQMQRRMQMPLELKATRPKKLRASEAGVATPRRAVRHRPQLSVESGG